MAQFDISSTVQSVTGEEENFSDSGPVVLNTEQVEMMNKIYTERSDEYGFCFNRREVNQSADLRHPVSVDQANSTAIDWSCPTGFEGIIHTHPGWDAVPSLSEVDKMSLVNSSYSVSCVMAGTISLSGVDNPDDFNCFNNTLPGHDSFESETKLKEAIQQAVFQRVDVRIKSSTK